MSRGARIVDVWVNRRPDDIFIDQLTAWLNIDTMTAAERRTAMDRLIRHVVVDPAKPAAAGECGWCPTRRQLATVPDGKRRLPQFSKLMASAAGRRVVGEPCERCTKTALGAVSRRVHKSSGRVIADGARKTVTPA